MKHLHDHAIIETPAAPPSRACAPAREGGAPSEIAPGVILTAYKEAVCGVLAVIRFGAMMAKLDTVLARENGAKTSDPGYNGGLRAWLAAHCPEVGYKTAMRMKGTAEAVCAGLGVGASALLRALNPDPKALPDEEDGEALIALREALVGIVAGKSERSLVLWLKGGAPAAPEAAAAESTGGAEVKVLDAARRFARAAADALQCLDGRQRRAVGADVARALRDALGLKGLAWLAKVLEEAEG